MCSYILFILVGILFGLFAGFLIFRVDADWKKFLSFGTGSGGIFGITFFLFSTLNIPSKDHISLLTVNLLFFITSILIVIPCLALSLKKQNVDKIIEISILDILIGNTELLKNYNKFKTLYLEEKQSKIKKHNIELEKKKLKSQTDSLTNLKKNLEKTANKAVHFELPISKPIAITDELISYIPEFCENLVSLTEHLSYYTKQSIRKLEKATNNKDKQDIILGYFMSCDGRFETTLN